LTVSGGAVVVSNTVRIVGCGRWSMTDDQAGPAVARLLARRNLPGVHLAAVESPLDGIIVDAGDIDGALFVVDAAVADRHHPPGSTAVLDYRHDARRLPLLDGGSTHTLGLADALRLADELGALPPCVRIYVIFGQDFTRGLEPSPPVRAAIDELAERIAHDARQILHETSQLAR